MPLSIELSVDQIKEIVAAAAQPKPHSGAHLLDVDYVEFASGEITSEHRERVLSHVSICSSCASQVEDLLLKMPKIIANISDIHSDVVKASSTAIAPPRSFDSAAYDDLHTRALALLNTCGAVERAADYLLPSGLHCDTHINLATVCSSEEALCDIADLFLELFKDTEFDTIVSHGWTMGMIARRMASRLRERVNRVVAVACTEGYGPPTLATDLDPSQRVLVLIDVFVTGKLIDDLRTLLETRGSRVLGFGVVASHRPGSETFGRIRVLCTIPFEVQRTRHCQRCGVLPLLQFNPVSCCMTSKRTEPRSPTEFLREHPEALEFWEAINDARACERHRIERDTHHLTFVNVKRLLESDASRKTILSTLAQTMSLLRPCPSTFIVPDRARAQLLAEHLASHCTDSGVENVELVPVIKTPGGWHIDPSLVQRIRQRHVLVIDSAVGHGSTVDELWMFSRQFDVASFGVVTVISRLSETHETALRRLTRDRYIAAFRFPMRPLALHQGNELCPVCRETSELAAEANVTGAQALKGLLNHLRSAAMQRRMASAQLTQEKAAQLPLPGVPLPPLLERCSRNVAAGVMLNALHASRNNGMAPLKLPELSDSNIPLRNRTAMVESLPAGVSRWSGSELVRNLEACLRDDEVDSLWAAASTILARETGEEWIRLFIAKTEQAPQLWTSGSETNWDRVAYSIHQVTRRNFSARQALFQYVNRVKASFRSSVPDSVHKVMEVTESDLFDAESL